MTESEFFENVVEMRKYQIAFFKAKHGGFFDKGAYDKAREYEKIVDKYIKEHKPVVTDTQQSLFPKS